MRSAILMLVALLLLLAACGAPEQPTTQKPSPAPPQASTAPAQPVNPSLQPAAAAPQATNGTPVARGRKLRDVWPGVKGKQPSTTALLYSSIVPTEDDQLSRMDAFWRINLNDVNSRQRIAEITTDKSLDEPIFGQLSPDGTRIAYFMPTSEYLADLYVMRSDGTNEQRIATGIARNGGDCHKSFAWSPDSTRLAIIQDTTRDQTYDEEVVIYDLNSNVVSDPIQVGWAFLVGWQGPQRVLAITSSGQGQPRVLDAIDVAAKKRQALGQLPEQAFFCSNPSPDRQKILLDLGSSYLFNASTRAFRKLDAAAQVSAWNPDNATIVEITGLKPNTAKILDVTAAQLSAQSVTLADDAPTTAQSLLSASPDGHYLVTCETREVGSGQLLARTLLYDIANDQWEPLLEGQGCVKVLGWQ